MIRMLFHHELKKESSEVLLQGKVTGKDLKWRCGGVAVGECNLRLKDSMPKADCNLI